MSHGKSDESHTVAAESGLDPLRKTQITVTLGMAWFASPVVALSPFVI